MRDLACMKRIQCTLLLARALRFMCQCLSSSKLGCQLLSPVEILGGLGLEDGVCCAHVAFGFAETAFCLIQRPVR